MLTELFIAVSLLGASSSPAPATPVDSTAAVDLDIESVRQLLESLRAPITVENVRAVVELHDGIHLEVSYDLQPVGRVIINVHTDEVGSGRGLVVVSETAVAELWFLEGAMAAESMMDFSTLKPAQARALAASITQIWHDETVVQALTIATSDDRDLKCKLAGQIAGSLIGVGAFAACELTYKVPVTCGKAGGTVWGAVSTYITDKCNDAQNH